MHYIRSLTIMYISPYTQLTNQILLLHATSGKDTSVVCIARVSHSAFTGLLDRWWTNSFGGDIC